MVRYVMVIVFVFIKFIRLVVLWGVIVLDLFGVVFGKSESYR